MDSNTRLRIKQLHTSCLCLSVAKPFCLLSSSCVVLSNLFSFINHQNFTEHFSRWLGVQLFPLLVSLAFSPVIICVLSILVHYQLFLSFSSTFIDAEHFYLSSSAWIFMIVLSGMSGCRFFVLQWGISLENQKHLRRAFAEINTKISKIVHFPQFSSWHCQDCDSMIELIEHWLPVLPPWVTDNIRDQLILPRLQVC